MQTQEEFDITIGRLDRVLSLMVNWAKDVRKVNDRVDDGSITGIDCIDPANQQTLKHHAEDMIAAGQKILECLDHVKGTPQPKPATAPQKLIQQTPPFTPRAMKVLNFSREAACSRGDDFVGTEHLLIALVREREGIAWNALTHFLDVNAFRDYVISLLPQK